MKRVIGIFLMLVVSGILVSTAVDKMQQWHSSDAIYVKINGFNVTLQDAIVNNYFTIWFSPNSSSTVADYGHWASQILIITTNGHIMTLQEAVDHGELENSTQDYTINLLGGHLASEIEVLIDGNAKSLQEAINNKELISCVADVGTSCGESLCTNAGTIACDGSCVGTSYKPEETNCGVDDCPSYNLDTMCWQCSGNNKIKSITCTGNRCSSGNCVETLVTKIIASEYCTHGCAKPRCFTCPECSAICSS